MTLIVGIISFVIVANVLVMSFREVTNWISLAAMGFAVWLFLPPCLRRGVWRLIAQMRTLIVGMISFVIVANVLVAIIAPRLASENADGRDRQIDLRGDRAASVVLAVIAVTLMGHAYLNGEMFYANALFLALVASEVVKNLWSIMLYRRGS